MRGTLYRAEIEPMTKNPPDRVQHTDLWKVLIYEGERFVRTDTERVTHSEAQEIAEQLNSEFGVKRKAKGNLNHGG